jgi:hypothetical protein
VFSVPLISCQVVDGGDVCYVPPGASQSRPYKGGMDIPSILAVVDEIWSGLLGRGEHHFKYVPVA